jgi:predicted transposase YdaD
MHDYDVALKLLLQTSAHVTLRKLVGTDIVRWLDVELPKVQTRRADLLAETVEGDIVQLELQSTNDASMALRMGEYSFGVLRLFGRFPRQIVLYVGEPPLRMQTELRGPDQWFRFRAIDVRELDGEELLESVDVGDNVIAVLTRLRDRRAALKRIVARIAELPPEKRRSALDPLLILAGLRKLEPALVEEVRTMPLEIDLMENEIIAGYYRRGLEEGREKGREEGREKGREEGREEGELAVLRRLIEKRFGAIPEWAQERLATRSTKELEELSERLLDAGSLKELLK